MGFFASRSGIVLTSISMLVIGMTYAKQGCWPLGNGCFSRLGAHEEFKTYAQDKAWAEKIRAGGYILYFRHAHRERWPDVTAFDAVELLTAADGESTSYKRAVCLSAQGIEEAKLIGAVFKLANIKVDSVIASPSCRARQTATHAFGRIDGVRNSLLHRTAIPQDQHAEFGRDLRKLIDGLNPRAGTNIVLSAHAGTFRFDKSLLVDLNMTDGDLDGREETGFVVLEKKDGKLMARHKFVSVRHLAVATLQVPVTGNQMAASPDQARKF